MTFFFTLLFMLMVFWRPQEWLVPQLYGWPILDAVVYLALLGLLMEAGQGIVHFRKRSPQVWLLFGLWIAAIVSHVPHTYLAGMQLAATDVFKISFFTLLLFTVLDRPSRFRFIATVFVVMAATMAVHALLQARRGYGFAGQTPLRIPAYMGREEEIRTTFFGIFSDPNDLAQILVSAMPMAFLIRRRQNLLTIAPALAVLALLYMAYLTTGSRGGMVALIATVGVGVTLLLPTRWLPWVMGVGLIAALGVARVKGGAFLDMSARERVVFWGYGNQAFKANPIFGVGYDMFWQISAGRPAHNAFVTCYTELGLFGYWMWFNLLQLGVLSAWRTREALKSVRHPEAAYLRRFCGLGIASLAGFSAGAYFLSRTFIFPYFFLMAMLNAAPFIARRYLPPGTPPLLVPRRDVWVRGTLVVLASIVYIYISIVFLNASLYG